MFAATPKPPYYAVIFTSRLTTDTAEYEATAHRMTELAGGMPGYLGIESVRGPDGFGITVSYWRSEMDIVNWKSHLEHQQAQQTGKDRWYEHYELRIARVERNYGGPEGC